MLGMAVCADKMRTPPAFLLSLSVEQSTNDCVLWKDCLVSCSGWLVCLYSPKKVTSPIARFLCCLSLVPLSLFANSLESPARGQFLVPSLLSSWKFHKHNDSSTAGCSAGKISPSVSTGHVTDPRKISTILGVSWIPALEFNPSLN